MNFSPVENGSSFLENSRIKAEELYRLVKTSAKESAREQRKSGNNRKGKKASGQAIPLFILAEDSGIAVDALGGAPGIYSARFGQEEAGRHLSAREQNALLLRKLNALPAGTSRRCRYVCCISLICLDPVKRQQGIVETLRTLTITEHLEGEVAQQLPAPLTPPAQLPAQSPPQGGFGYDPIFYLPERGCTAAEISPEEKNAISHRGRATRIALNEILSLYNF